MAVALGHATGETNFRPLSRPPGDADLAASKSHPDAGADRLRKRLLCCKAYPIMFSRAIRKHPAVPNFLLGKNPPLESLAIFLQRVFDARDLDNIASDAEYPGCCSSVSARRFSRSE